LRRRVLAIERALAVLAQRDRARPSRQHLRGVGDLAARHLVATVKRDRPGQDMPVERGGGQRVTRIARAGDVVGGERIEPALQLRYVGGDRRLAWRLRCVGRRNRGRRAHVDAAADRHGGRQRDDRAKKREKVRPPHRHFNILAQRQQARALKTRSGA